MIEELNRRNLPWIAGEARCEDASGVAADLARSVPCPATGRPLGPPDRVLMAAGATGRPNVDWCDRPENLPTTVQSNLVAPLVVAEAVRRANAGGAPCHLTYFGTGCIYTYGEGRRGRSPGGRGRSAKLGQPANPLPRRGLRPFTQTTPSRAATQRSTPATASRPLALPPSTGRAAPRPTPRPPSPERYRMRRLQRIFAGPFTAGARPMPTSPLRPPTATAASPCGSACPSAPISPTNATSCTR